jgi:hypothetical protein
MAAVCAIAGRTVRTFFTIWPQLRYDTAMLLFVVTALAASAASPPAQTGTVTSQARATIRIVSAVRLRVGADSSEDGIPVRSASLRTDDGSAVAARLVELE